MFPRDLLADYPDTRTGERVVYYDTDMLIALLDRNARARTTDETLKTFPHRPGPLSPGRSRLRYGAMARQSCTRSPGSPTSAQSCRPRTTSGGPAVPRLAQLGVGRDLAADPGQRPLRGAAGTLTADALPGGEPSAVQRPVHQHPGRLAGRPRGPGGKYGGENCPAGDDGVRQGAPVSRPETSVHTITVLPARVPAAALISPVRGVPSGRPTGSAPAAALGARTRCTRAGGVPEQGRGNLLLRSLLNALGAQAGSVARTATISLRPERESYKEQVCR